MRLAMEIPIPELENLSPLADLDFALAHMVLDDPYYRDFYRDQSARGRRVILDNSMHEMQGNPLPMSHIVSAANAVKPWVVIPPDKLGQSTFTMKAAADMYSHVKGRHKLAVVLCGRTSEERFSFFRNVMPLTCVLCLPFREPRLAWFKELYTRFGRPTPRIHLLGVSTLQELADFRSEFEATGYRHDEVSVDTNKMLKFGIRGERINEQTQLRGLPQLDLGARLETCVQRESTLYNIAFVRKFL